MQPLPRYTKAAARTLAAEQQFVDTVASRTELVRNGYTPSQITARVAARRWQRVGRAFVLHRGELTRREKWEVALLNCEPRSVLASFTALELLGLRGWERDEVHLLASAGARRPAGLGFPLIFHRTRRWDPDSLYVPRRTQRVAAALALAAGSLPSPRSACGVLAAGVQQRLASAGEIRRYVASSPTSRHRAVLLPALDDIAGGSHALSEIDFIRLCRRFGLPEPRRQQIRQEPGGRRRYLDAEWRRRDGRGIVVEVDGAIHLVPNRWFDDQLRQNEIVLSDSLVLRYPSFIVRSEQQLVAGQLRRALEV